MNIDRPTGITDFDEWWLAYPRKVGRLAALRAYAKARIIATPDELLAGVLEFRKHLPDEMQFCPHAASWLNAGRWMDDYTPIKSEKPKLDAHKAYVPFAKRESA